MECRTATAQSFRQGKRYVEAIEKFAEGNVFGAERFAAS